MLEINDLHVTYGGIRALRSVSLDVGAGETVAIVGANGAGKSSLLGAITGTVPSKGSIRFDGTELVGMRAHRIARLGLRSVPEGGAAFANMTVMENLQLGLRGRADAQEAFASVYETFPKLAQRSRQLAGTLSGGERQMLAIARATLGQPRMLLLDEPSFGLAPVVVDEVFALIEQLTTTGLTVLLVEQNARRALAVSQRAYVLEQGAVVAAGPSATLLADDAVVEAYLGMA